MTRCYLAVVLAAVAMTGPGTAQTGDHKLTVTNGTDAAIEYLYLAGCGAGDWGKDRLGSKEIIKPGERRLFGIHGECCRDLRAKLETGASRQKLAADICRDAEWVVR